MKRILIMMAGLTAASFIASADPLCSTGFTLVNNAPTTNSSVYTIDGTATFGGTVGSGSVNGCTIGSWDFSNFTIAGNTGWTGQNLFVAIGASGNFFQISTNMNIAAGEDIEMEFSITPGISGMALSAGGGGGVNETICSTAEPIGGGLVGSCSGVLLAQASVGGGVSVATFNVLPSPTGVDWVFKDISGASEITQQILPEPMTFTLMGAGLLGLGVLGRRRFTK